MRLSLGIQGKLSCLIGSFVCLIGIIVGVASYVANTQTTDAAVIDTAAGQRLLLFQIKSTAKGLVEALESESSTDELIQGLSSMLELFESGLSALLNGGAYLDAEGHEVQVSAIKGEAYTALQKVETTWTAYRKGLAIIMAKEMDVSSDAFYDALDILDKMFDPVAIAAGKAVPLLKTVSEQKVILLKQVLAAALGLTLLVTLVSLFVVRRLLIQPIRKAVGMIQDLEQGNFSSRLEINEKHQMNSKDEILVLAKAMNLMTTKLGKLFTDISEGVKTLNNSSNHLSSISGQMSSSTEETSTQVKVIAASAEEMNINIKSVATTMENASSNVKGIERSIEQLAITEHEIANNSEKGREIAGKAVIQARNTSAIMDELKGSANEIGDVTETIAEISDQINLLALNATIESARAGEAGRGFAVVANEIKDLAKQTADATEAIRLRIEGIQNTTANSVSEIEGIAKIITKVDDIVSTIAISVDEQSAATREITNKIVQVTQGMAEADISVNQSTNFTADITKDIIEISHTTNEMAASSSEVSMNADELSNLSDQLNGMINNFNGLHDDSDVRGSNEYANSDGKSEGITNA